MSKFLDIFRSLRKSSERLAGLLACWLPGLLAACLLASCWLGAGCWLAGCWLAGSWLPSCLACQLAGPGPGEHFLNVRRYAPDSPLRRSAAAYCFQMRSIKNLEGNFQLLCERMLTHGGGVNEAWLLH